MGLVARRYLQGGRLNLDEVAVGKPTARGAGDGIAHEQPWAAVGMNVWHPPG